MTGRGSSKNSIRTLVLALRYPYRASYYDDWADAFAAAPFFATSFLNVLDLTPASLEREIKDQDLIVLLHNCTADTTAELERLAPVLGNRSRSRLVSFVGNEYNSPYAPLGAKIATLRACRPDIIATQLLEEAGVYLYGDFASRVISLPHALNPDVFRPGPPDNARMVDIGVRSYRYSPLLGDTERNNIIDYFRLHSDEFGLRVDISTASRFGRDDWAAFLAGCRGTISSEAGSWYLDRDDALVRRIAADIRRERPGFIIEGTTPLRRLVRRLPVPIKTLLGSVLRHGPVKFAGFEDDRLDFDDLYQRFFRDAPRCPVYSKALSSRHFDAIGTKTCQIMIAGRYNDILVADQHYIAVAPDLSNVAEAVARFKDFAERGRIAEGALEYARAGHTHHHRMKALHDHVLSL